MPSPSKEANRENQRNIRLRARTQPKLLTFFAYLEEKNKIDSQDKQYFVSLLDNTDKSFLGIES